MTLNSVAFIVLCHYRIQAALSVAIAIRSAANHQGKKVRRQSQLQFLSTTTNRTTIHHASQAQEKKK
jgi:hypothetical protein